MSNVSSPHPSGRMHGPEGGGEVLEKDGRHEETRTPDLYRVKVQPQRIFNYIEETDGILSR